MALLLPARGFCTTCRCNAAAKAVPQKKAKTVLHKFGKNRAKSEESTSISEVNFVSCALLWHYERKIPYSCKGID